MPSGLGASLTPAAPAPMLSAQSPAKAPKPFEKPKIKAGKLIGQARTTTDPVSKAALLSQGKALAVAAMVLAKADKAGEDASNTTSNAAGQLGGIARQTLGGGQGQGGDQVKDDQLDKPAKTRRNVDRRSNPNYSGDIDSVQ